MKRSLAVLAAFVTLSVLGCGGPTFEDGQELEAAPASGAGEVHAQACTAGVSCDDLDLTYCGKRGLTTSCCLGENTYTCTCTSAGWGCP